MSKQYAHLHTMAKTSVKFQNDWPKTVGGVALTRHPLSIVDERTGQGTPISHLRANAGGTKGCGPHGFREEDFLRFSHYKSMGANNPWGMASLGLRGLIGRIYVGDH